MATEGDRNLKNEANLPKQNWRTRVDPRHSQSSVPVLFRLKNLQRVSLDTPEELRPVSSVEGAPKPVKNGPAGASRTSTRRDSAANTPSGSKSSSSSGPVAAAKPDPVTSPGKSGVSNGFILLIAAIVVAFMFGRNMSGKTQVASTAPVVATPVEDAKALNTGSVSGIAIAATESNSPTSALTPSPKPVEPLVIPELPKLTIDESSADEKADGTPTKTSEASTELKRSEDGLLTVEIDSSVAPAETTASKEEEKLALPTTLTVIENPNVSKTTGAEPKSETTIAPSLVENAAANPALPPKNETVSSQSMLVTATPDRDIESLMRVRRSYQETLAQNPYAAQSQLDALARAKQGIPATSTPDFKPPQTNLAYNPNVVPNNVPPNNVPVNTVPSNNGTIAAQAVGYGQPSTQSGTPAYVQPNAQQNMPTYAQPAAQPNVPRYAPPNPAMAPATNNAAPAGISDYAQPVNQPYRPVFSDPSSMPMPSTGGNFSVPPPAAPYQPIGNTFSPVGY